MVDLNEILPPKVIVNRSRLDSYGGLHIIAEYVGLKEPIFEINPNIGFWSHGWTPDFFLKNPDVVITDIEKIKEKILLVPKKSEEIYLHSKGYTNAKAIGLPHAYLEEKKYKRIPNSLLVMPIHSDNTIANAWKFQEYVDEIKSIAHEFDRVVVCVHPLCIRDGYWVNEFQDAGFEIIEGIYGPDKNALKRLQVIMSSFEYITTNGFGSLIAYAAFFGAKISIWGSFAFYTKEDYKNNIYYEQNPEMLDLMLSLYSEKTVKENLGYLFTHPKQAIERTEWGKQEVGFNDKISINEILELFKWKNYYWSPKGWKYWLSENISENTKNWLKSFFKESKTEIKQDFYDFLPPKVEVHRNRLDAYGALHIMSEYAGFDNPIFETDKIGYWSHGWIPDFRIKNPQLIVSDIDEIDNDAKIFITKNKSKEYLKLHGFNHNIFNIGLSIIYLSPIKIPRISNSLLVMPVHSDNTLAMKWKFQQYVDEINEIKHQFDRVVVCIHPLCIRDGYWINEFKAAGYEVIEGIYGPDKNALKRLQVLLSSFEYVTTNGFGSLLVYAAYFGAKPSIWGTFAEYSHSDYKNNPFYQKRPEILDLMIDLYSEKTCKENLSFLFSHPKKAIERREWGAYEVGIDSKKSPSEIRELFGWKNFYWTKKGIKYWLLENFPESLKKFIKRPLNR